METMEPFDTVDTLLHCALWSIIKPWFPNYLYNSERVLGIHLMSLVSVIMILGVSWLPWHQVTLTGTLGLSGAATEIK